MLECEARRLARVLSTYGAVAEPTLFELAGARAWQRGSFARACDLAVRLGLIRRLGLGFYGAAREHAPDAVPLGDGARDQQSACAGSRELP